MNKYTCNNQEVNKQTTVSKHNIDILQRIKCLETLVDELVNNKIDKQNLKDFIKFNKEIDVVVSYRLDYTTKERFKNFCNKHSEYKTKDILSSVLNDFLDKYE